MENEYDPEVIHTEEYRKVMRTTFIYQWTIFGHNVKAMLWIMAAQFAIGQAREEFIKRSQKHEWLVGYIEKYPEDIIIDERNWHGKH